MATVARLGIHVDNLQALIGLHEPTVVETKGGHTTLILSHQTFTNTTSVFIVINVSANVSWPSSEYSEGIGQQPPLYTKVHAHHINFHLFTHNPYPHITCAITLTPAPAHT